MATIRPNDNAPDEAVNFSLGSATFSLEAGGSVETDDREVISDAREHPWLTVEESAEDTSVQQELEAVAAADPDDDTDEQPYSYGSQED